MYIRKKKQINKRTKCVLPRAIARYNRVRVEKKNFGKRVTRKKKKKSSKRNNFKTRFRRRNPVWTEKRVKRSKVVGLRIA